MNSSCSGRGESVDNHHFLLTEDSRSGSHIEFGAQQCRVVGLILDLCAEKLSIGILVRDDVARQKLREQVGDIGLIM